ncbi:MAG: T9SS type A sorting domain-containing protein, partial [Bacteroidales bacterium]
ATDVPWYDNLDNTGYIYSNSYYSQPYYPSADSFPSVNRDSYTLGGTMIKAVTDSDGTAGYRSYPRAFGYADNLPRGEPPWDIPDNPYTREVENSGGDAFDISWARDEEGRYVELDTVHFIRVHNAVMAGAGALGELSTEITGAVDVSPAAGITGLRDMIVIKDLPPSVDSSAYQLEVFVFHKGRVVTGNTLVWTCSMEDAEVDEDNILRASSAGEISITASLADDPGISTTVSTVISTAAVALPAVYEAEEISLYPNPAGEHIRIRGVEDAAIRIFSTGGRLLAEKEDYSGGDISTAILPAGIYIVRIESGTTIVNRKLIKR